MKLLSWLISATHRDERKRLRQTNRKLVNSEDSESFEGCQCQAAATEQIQILSDNIYKLNEQLKLRKDSVKDQTKDNNKTVSHAEEVSWYQS